MSDDRIEALLASVRGKHLTRHALAEASVTLAGYLLELSLKRISPQDRRQAEKLARMMDDPAGKALTLVMADQVFRSSRNRRKASQFTHLLRGYGIPEYMSFTDRLLLKLGLTFAPLMPGLVMPMVTQRLRDESAQVILPSEDHLLKGHIRKRRKAGTRLNLNQLGEAVLGEAEARNRMDAVINRLASPDVEYISVKITAIFSQVNVVAYEQTLELLKERLRELYRVAMAHQFTRADGTVAPKFVNLDMEEYRDLHLTTDAFCQVLDEAEFLTLEAGIVLQAYLPDSYGVQQILTRWSRQRIERGGAPIKIRLVKGANLAMETVEAESHHWPQAPYETKADVDANYKRMVTWGLQPENARHVHIGLASHNLFDIAYALILREIHQVNALVEFEMLEGMANHQASVVQEVAGGLLLYAPVVRKEDFPSAIAYLVRRLDENTASENYLHDLFTIRPGNAFWQKQKQWFQRACERQDLVASQPNRRQNRATDICELGLERGFENIPDTDWVLRHNVHWIEGYAEKWLHHSEVRVPLQIGGELIGEEFPGEGQDPGRPGTPVYRYALADAAQVDQALTVAVRACEAWAEQTVSHRREMLIRAASEIARNRGDMIGAMMLDGGKAIPEADVEVSEAIDFANYYARAYEVDGLEGLAPVALGVVVITPPWNFPFAIPCGGILAALMAGNTVIFKPAPEAVLIGWQLVQQLWAAGIPKEALQFVPCPDNEVGRALLTDSRTSAVILTGAYDTARLFQSWKPDLRLLAETSGKNCLIITGNADYDLAIKDLVKSAFGHAGQKCSAASLAILEAEVYDNPDFLRQLKDAAVSLHVGTAWDPASIVTPVIRPPDDTLTRGLTTLEPGESWLLEPRMLEGNPCLWSPGIKLGVERDSFYHRAECFGPVLGLMRAKDLAEAIEIANDSEFGLTGGLHSLDDREINFWRERVEVGNAYINRGITGAIVRRQPFGGWKKSAFGPGAKAGGPNYVFNLSHWKVLELPARGEDPVDQVQRTLTAFEASFPGETDREILLAAARNYAWAWHGEFSREHDPSRIHGEYNHFRYRNFSGVVARVNGPEEQLDGALAVLASLTTGTALRLSLGEPLEFMEVVRELPGITVLVESEEELATHIEAMSTRYHILRAAGGVCERLHEAAVNAHMAVVDGDVVPHGRIELQYYLKEQSVTFCHHRYGNVIPPPGGL